MACDESSRGGWRFPFIARVWRTALTSGLLLGLATAAAAQPPATRSAEQVLERRFADIEREVRRLAARGQHDESAALNHELERFRSLLTAAYDVPPGDQTEVHLVALGAGSTAPEGTLTGPDRFTRGYAEVKLTFNRAPVVLALTAAQSVHWKLEVAEGVKLRAVVLSGYRKPTVSGVPAGVLVYECSNQTRPEESFFGQNWGAPDYYELARKVGWLTGHPLRTLIGADRYEGKPIVVGPENLLWRQQHLVPATAPLHRRALEADRAEAFAKVADLRFDGVYYTPRELGQPGHYPQGDYAVAAGEFTAAGPIAATLRPQDPNIARVVHDAKENIRFALTTNGELVVYNPLSEEQQQPVPLAPELNGGLQAAALAFDTTRRRLILSERNPPFRLLAYRLDEAQWEVLAQLETFLPGLVYVPETDSLYGVTAFERHAAEQEEALAAAAEPGRAEAVNPYGRPAAVLELSPTGQVRQTIRPSVRLGATTDQMLGSFLAHDQGRLVIVPPPRPGPWNRTLHPIFVIDLKTKDVIYSGQMRIHDGQGKPPVEEDDPPPAGGGGLDRLFKQIAEVSGGVEALRSSGQLERAEAYARRLAALQAHLAGDFQPPAAPAAELHAVSMYRPHGVVVEVTHVGAPIVLALSGYEAGEWTVRLAPHVKLERVLLGGQKRQRIQGLPPETPVEMRTHQDQVPDAFFLGHGEGNQETQQALATLEKLTGLEPATVQWAPQASEQPVVVGPEGTAWRMQVIERALAALAGQLPAARDPYRERLDELTFAALWESAIPPQPQPRPRMPGRPVERTLEWARFTPRGPLAQTLVPLPGDLEQVVFDEAGSTYYGSRANELLRVDAATGKSEAIPVDASVPPLDQPLSLAFDSKRRRLLITNSSGQGCLLAYQVDQKAWSVVSRPAIAAQALVYSPEEDALFAILERYGQYGGFAKFNPQGALLESYAVATPYPRRAGRGRRQFVYYRHFGAGRWQLAYSQGFLVVVRGVAAQFGTRRFGGPPGPSGGEAEIEVFDPATGKSTDFGAARLHPGRERLDGPEVQRLWEQLAEEDGQAADKAVWRLAAGHTEAVRAIEERLPPLPKVDERRLAELIEQLDSSEAAVRRAAFDTLSEWGGSIEPQLTRHANHPSAEVRSQVRRLLKNAKELLPATASLRQQQRALAVLELVDTPSARDLLERLAADDPEHPRTRAAREALERLKAPGEGGR